MWPGPRSGLDYETEVFSCSRLNRYLASPYNYYLESVLRLESSDDRARELDPLQFGKLLHAVLERFGNEPGMKDLEDEPSIREAVFALLHEEGAQRFGHPARPLVELQLLQAELRLRLFARKQAELRAEGWQIHAVEWSPPGGAVPLEFDRESFSLRGYIDRVDMREVDGCTQWHIIDYKSGDKPKGIGNCWKSRAKRWEDVQLALYPFLTRSLTGGRGAAIEGGPVQASYWNLGAHDSNHSLDGFPLDDEMREQLELQVAAAVRGIRAEDFFDPEQPRRHRSKLAMRCMGDGLLAAADEEDDGVEDS